MTTELLDTRPCVAVVHHDQSVRAALSAVLEQNGYAAFSCGFSDDVVSLMLQRPPALILIEVICPGIGELTSRSSADHVQELCTHLHRQPALEHTVCLALMPIDSAGEAQICSGTRRVDGVVLWPVATCILLGWLRTYARWGEVRVARDEAEDNYRSLFANNHAVMLVVNPQNGQVVDANPAAEHFYGWTRDQLCSMRVTEINTMAPEDLRHAMARAKAMNQNYFQFRHRLASGAVRDVEVYSGPVRFQGRELLYSLVFDITARKQAEKALEAARRDWEDIFQAIGHPAMVVSPEWTILAANKATVQATGLSAAELHGLRCFEIFHGMNMHPADCPLKRMHESGHLETQEMEVQVLGGYYFVSCTPVYDAAGNLNKVIHIATDISRRRKAEAELEATNRNLEDAIAHAHELAALSDAANKAKSVFLANMSHEIRTPLNGVCGMLQLMQTTTLDAEQTEYARVALKSAARLEQLLSDILELSKLETDGVCIQAVSFSPAVLLEHMRDLFALAASQKGLRFECELDARVPDKLIGDEVRVRQILFNLLGNAVKFTAQGFVRLRISLLTTVRQEMRLLFVVEDSGIGISEILLQRIFENFEQGEDSFVRNYQGAGLGLAIVRRLTCLLGGDLAAESEPGQGTRMCLALPFALPIQGQTRPGNVGGPAQTERALRILVAEDDPLNALYLERGLRKFGDTVVVAENGEKVLKALEQGVFDAILMDVQMPIMDGLEATRAIRAQSGPVRDIPIIALTAYAMTGDKDKFLLSGMDAYISKPVRIEDVRAEVKRVVAAKTNILV